MSTPCRCGAVTIGQWRVWTADGMLHGVDGVRGARADHHRVVGVGAGAGR